MKVLLASNNKHKLDEILEIFNREKPGFIDLCTPKQVLSESLDVEENGETLHDNALLKARAFFEASNIVCIADDTGLEIDALNGQPGVRSARFAGEACIDADNRVKVLDLMKNIDDDKRTARFKTVFCYCDGKNEYYAEGICEGNIINAERGASGFGYDPIFVPDGFDRTFAEMSAEEKNKISHRGKASMNLVNLLINL